MDGISAAAAAVNVEDPVSTPDGKVFPRSAGEENGRGMTNDADGVWIRTHAARFYPPPDAGVAIVSRAAVDQVKLLRAHREVPMIRQGRQEAEDAVSLGKGTAVTQLPVSDHPAVLAPQLPRAVFVVGAQCAQTHLLVVSQEQRHVGGLHDLFQQRNAIGTPVNYVAQDVQMIHVGEADLFQHLFKPVPLTVEIRHAVDHKPCPRSEKVPTSYHDLQPGTRFRLYGVDLGLFFLRFLSLSSE